MIIDFFQVRFENFHKFHPVTLESTRSGGNGASSIFLFTIFSKTFIEFPILCSSVNFAIECDLFILLGSIGA